jgi:diamine N-acetyltransferase
MIIGERIRFRAVERDDLPIFVKWINDPEVNQGIGIYLPYAMADENDWFEAMHKRPASEHNLAIEVKEVNPQDVETWMMIGSCGFMNYDQRNASAEFGIMIGEKSFWNQGYGTEAVRLLVKFGFQSINLNRIYLRVLENNPRAIRCYEKAGFTHEGRQRQADYRDGRYIDLLVMSILRSEFQPQ